MSRSALYSQNIRCHGDAAGVTAKATRIRCHGAAADVTADCQDLVLSDAVMSNAAKGLGPISQADHSPYAQSAWAPTEMSKGAKGLGPISQADR